MADDAITQCNIGGLGSSMYICVKSPRNFSRNSTSWQFVEILHYTEVHPFCQLLQIVNATWVVKLKSSQYSFALYTFYKSMIFVSYDITQGIQEWIDRGIDWQDKCCYPCIGNWVNLYSPSLYKDRQYTYWDPATKSQWAWEETFSWPSEYLLNS